MTVFEHSHSYDLREMEIYLKEPKQLDLEPAIENPFEWLREYCEKLKNEK